MVKIISIAIALCVVGISFSSYAKNPGKKAMDCVSSKLNKDFQKTKKHDVWVLSNTCSYGIFVIFCGEMKYSDSKCGTHNRVKKDSPAHFYTFSKNLKPGANLKAYVNVRAQFKFGACKGQISRSPEADWSDNSQGSFSCNQSSGNGQQKSIGF